MMTSEECLARAAELERKISETIIVDVSEEYRRLAAQWRTLAELAAQGERKRVQP